MGRLVIEFETRKAAQDFLQDLDALATLSHGAKGYDVWDDIEESPDSTYYVSSPTGDPRFQGWRLALACEGIERTLPDDWFKAE